MRAPFGVDLDVEEVRGTLTALVEEGRPREAVALAVEKLAYLAWALAQANLAVSQFKKKYDGKTSEQMPKEQLRLLLAGAELPTDLDELLASDDHEAAVHEARREKRKQSKKKNRGRQPLPPHLPRRRTELWPPEHQQTCAACNCMKRKIGEETSEMLELVPAEFFVQQFARIKMECPSCGDKSIGPIPDRVIEGGLPGPKLLAHVLVGKYQDHSPLHRLHRIFLRYGVDLAVSTLADWVERAHELLGPLVAEIVRACLLAHVLQGDDTGIKVLDRDAPGGSKRGRLWCYVGDGRWAAFEYSPDWKGEHPQNFLADRKGWFQADAYKGFDALFTPDSALIEVGCWMHARRYWVEANEAGDTRAAIPLRLIQKLYSIETEADVADLDPDARKELRQRRAKPILDSLWSWIAHHHYRENPKSLFAKATGYAIRQWTALTRYLEDGRLPIDNGGVERAVRPVACGRRSYLFCGSDAGGDRAATLYTILGTCALNRAEPMAYLADVLEKLASGWPMSRIDELLPPRWIELHPEHRVGVPSPPDSS